MTTGRINQVATVEARVRQDGQRLAGGRGMHRARGGRSEPSELPAEDAPTIKREPKMDGSVSVRRPLPHCEGSLFKTNQVR